MSDRRPILQKKVFEAEGKVYTDDRSVYERVSWGYRFVYAWSYDEQSRQVMLISSAGGDRSPAPKNVQDAYAAAIAGSIVN